MIVYVLEALWLDSAKEPQQAIEGVFTEWQAVMDRATVCERDGRSINPAMFFASLYEVPATVPTERYTRWANGVWEKIPKP